MGVFVAIVILIGVGCGIAAVATGQLVIPAWLLGVAGVGGLWLMIGSVSYHPSRRDAESEYHTRAAAIDAQIQSVMSRAVAFGRLCAEDKIKLDALYAARERNNQTWKG